MLHKSDVVVHFTFNSKGPGATGKKKTARGNERKRKESDRAKRAHGGVKNEKFTEIVLIYAGSERSELASDSAKLMQFIAAVFDAFLRSRPWFCPRKPRACQPVAGVAGCSVASGDL